MKITRKTLRRILREAITVDRQSVYAFNRMLTQVLADISEESIQFGNDEEINSAIDDIEAGMLRLKKAIMKRGGISP